MSVHFHQLTIKEVRKETEECVSVAFTIPSEDKSKFQFLAGQYLSFRQEINGEEIRRSYSICSAPHENELRVAIKKVENGKFSTWANETLKDGMTLEVMEPMGKFTLALSPNEKRNHVLIAAGSGITPILSLCKTILHEEPNSSVNLVYGNKGFSSIVFREEIEALKNEYLDRLFVLHILSRESVGNPLQKGRIDKEKLTKIHTAFFKETSIDSVFVCGPEEMIHATKEVFSANGTAENKIHFELFGTSTAGAAKKAVILEENKHDSSVSIIIDGDAIDFKLNTDGISILDAGFLAGGDLPFACKGGVCCTCKAKIIEGTAVMDINYALEKEEVEAGYILTCQAHPTSEKLIVSFDD